ACNHIEDLKLKAVVHSGSAAFFNINEHQELTGKDVIIAHRLLKNSVEADEYILLTEPAYNELVLPAGKVVKAEEVFEDIGTVETYVYYPPQFEPVVDQDATGLSEVFTETLREEVKKEYSQVAEYPELGFHFHTGRRLAEMLAYKEEWLEGLPEVVIESFAGTGNPFTLGELEPGMRVVDPGSGAGLDCIIASKMVGPAGEVMGIDMTEAMVAKAQRNIRRAGARNVFIKAGFIEDLPVPDGWADVILSNGAVNLAPDKEKVFAEFFRVLKPGGRLQIADIIVSKPVPESAKRRIELWAG
ncbi:MAG: DUF2652 domain-containing protein, partial [Anaerolineales bacterium]|nr:DUF2652 domain-containing protein [Anaerolineales bacterium]